MVLQMTETSLPDAGSAQQQQSGDDESPAPSALEDNPELMRMYEEMFKHRYTDKDVDFMKTVETELQDQPCVENWYSRPKRSWDYAR